MSSTQKNKYLFHCGYLDACILNSNSWAQTSILITTSASNFVLLCRCSDLRLTSSFFVYCLEPIIFMGKKVKD